MSIQREVFAVIKACSKTMVVVQHRCNTVETETIEVILCHPEL